MDGNAHASHAIWLYIIIYTIIWHQFPPSAYLPWVILFGMFPDFDGVIFSLKGHDTNENTFQHHLYFPSHWPIAYLPVVILSIIGFIWNWHPQALLIIPVGIYAHLISDSACCGDGMMWGKLPWKKGQFAVFYNFFSSQTDGYHGDYWRVRWRRTGMFKIAYLEGLTIIGLFLGIQILGGFSIALSICIGYFLINIFHAVKKVDPKYLTEPPNGRYDDYRKFPPYLQWMEANGYTFNTKMHAIKKKSQQNN